MSRIRIAAQAEEDLAGIWLYIARDNPQAADKLVAVLAQKYEVLAESPDIGRMRDELSPSLRSFPVRKYVIFYRPIEDGIEVIRVLSGYRDIDSLFAQ